MSKLTKTETSFNVIKECVCEMQICIHIIGSQKRSLVEQQKGELNSAGGRETHRCSCTAGKHCLQTFFPQCILMKNTKQRKHIEKKDPNLFFFSVV